MLKWFIQSCTKEDNPVDVVWAMYNHPWAWPSRSFEPSHHPLPPNAIPLDHMPPEGLQDDNPNTYSALQQYFASEVFHHINLEAGCLWKSKYLQTIDLKMAKFSWDTILNFSVDMVQQTTMELAPVIWSTVMSIAVDSDRAAGLKQARVSGKGSGKGSNHVHDPYLVSYLWVRLHFKHSSIFLGCLHSNYDAPLLSQFEFE